VQKAKLVADQVGTLRPPETYRNRAGTACRQAGSCVESGVTQPDANVGSVPLALAAGRCSHRQCVALPEWSSYRRPAVFNFQPSQRL